MMEYTDHAAFLTTAQNQLLQKLERQQDELLTQTTKFMTLLNTRTPPPTPTPTNTNTGHPRTSRNARPSKNPRFPRHCNSCNKDAVHHEDDNCYALDKNKDKRPSWCVAPNKLSSSAPQLSFESLNYWAPLSNTSHHRPTVRFRLPTQHRNTDSKTWRRQQSQKTHHRFTTHHKSNTPSMSTTALKQGILNGSIASAISDTGATSTAGAPHDPFNETTTISSKVFLLPTGGTAKATKVAKLLHKVRAPANMVDIVPSLEHTLLSGSKFADAGTPQCMTRQKSISTTPTPFTSPNRQYSQGTAAHAQVYGVYPYDQSSQAKTGIHWFSTLPVDTTPTTHATRSHPQQKFETT
eukprot:CCRYP_001372-RA/>CCRYP_001372-RA protein AED:0.71 eAED:0.36 QI:0/0/0/0.5/1/1/2/0/350